MPRVLNISVLHRVLQKTAHRILWVLNMLRLEYARVVNLPKLHRVLCILYFKDLQCLKVSEYSSDSEYTRVLNMSGLYKVLKKMLRHRHLTGF